MGEATLGRRLGGRAIAWGAACGTLPDLDVFIPFGDPVADFTYHRSFSHSLLIDLVAAPFIVWLILRIHPETLSHRWRWLLLVYLALATHALLDCFTVYGTQILWPLDPTPVAWGSVFIIDPLYTVPLLLGLTCAMVMSRSTSLGHLANWAAIGVSSLYLAWSLGAKLHVEEAARRSAASQGMPEARLLATPGPFNTVLWRVVAVEGNAYYEGFYSLLDPEPVVKFRRYPSHPELLRGLEQHWPVSRLQWFTKGFYSVRLEDDAVVISDLRMGLEPEYVFQFKVGVRDNPHSHPVPAVQLPTVRQWGRLPRIWERIFSAEVTI